MAELNTKIRYTINKLKTLTPAELTEWKDIHTIKLRQLAALFINKENATRMVR